MLPCSDLITACLSLSRARTLTAFAQMGELRPREGRVGLAQNGVGWSFQPFSKVSAYRDPHSPPTRPPSPDFLLLFWDTADWHLEKQQ